MSNWTILLSEDVSEVLFKRLPLPKTVNFDEGAMAVLIGLCAAYNGVHSEHCEIDYSRTERMAKAAFQAIENAFTAPPQEGEVSNG